MPPGYDQILPRAASRQRLGRRLAPPRRRYPAPERARTKPAPAPSPPLPPPARKSPKFRRRSLTSLPPRSPSQQRKPSSRSSSRHHLQVISTRRFWSSATPTLVGT